MQKLFILCLTLLVSASLVAQTKPTPQRPVSTMESAAVFLGKTAPLRDLAPGRVTSPEQKAKVKRMRPPRNFVGRGMPYITKPDALPTGADAVRQLGQNKSAIREVSLLANIEGISAQTAPHDPSGDIGRDYYIQAVNVTRFQIFHKDGTPASAPIAANTLWADLGKISAGDPIVLYDQDAERWIITEFPSGNELLFAISETTDPFGSWMAYSFGTPNFPDYPKYGIWDNAYVVTTNEEGSANQTAYFINRQEMLAGASTVPIQRLLVPGFANGPGFFVGTPVDWSGMTLPTTKPMIMRPNDDAWGDVEKDAIDIFEFDIDWDNADNTTFEMTRVQTAPFDTDFCSENGPGFGCVPQLNDNAIDGLMAVIMNQVHYQNFGTHESMVLNFTTDATGGDNIGGIRWVEMRKTADSTSWFLYQEGTFAPDDGLDRFMGAIAMDHDGNIAIAYTTSSSDTHPGLRVTGRLASDPLGTMTMPEAIIVAGNGTITDGDRYADYAQMAVDPFNGRSFWYTSEYGEADRVTTRIAGFDLAKDTMDFAGRSLIAPVTSSELTDSEPITVTIRNNGFDAQTGFDIGYIFEGGTPVVETVAVTLEPDSTYEHTFATNVDMLAIGRYEIQFFSDLTGDAFALNDSVRQYRTTLPKADASLVSITGFPASVCFETVEVFAEIENPSGRTLESAVITVSLDGAVVKTENWTGSIPAGESERVGIMLEGLTSGSYELGMTVSMPNGNTDEVPANNSSTAPLIVNLEGEPFTLALQLDFYPEETSWIIVDEDGNEVASSNGDYADAPFNALVNEELCLDPTKCYTIILLDAFGDGVEQGGFTIFNAAGEVVVSANGNFTVEQRGEFCASEVCAVAVSATTSPASGQGVDDGVIMLTLENTDGEGYLVSLNGDTLVDQTIFTGLLPGDYTVLVTNGEGCEVTETFTVGACSLAATAVAQGDSVTVSVSNGSGEYTFSIDSVNFQQDSLFLGVEAGTQTVYVRDGLGCSINFEIEVGFPTDVYYAETGQKVIIYPNPTEGVFRIELSGLNSSDIFLPIEIFDATGRLVQGGQLVRYDATFHGHFSILAQPSGVYYLRVVDPSLNKLLRLVKH